MRSRLASGTGIPGLLLAALAAGCGLPGEPLSPPVLEAAKASGPAPVVDATDPNQAPQETTIDVRVLGANFDDGSTVQFLLDQQPTNKVTTNSTTFVNSGELRANITIALDAAVALYDVQVTALRGRKGIGIEKFAVTVKIHPQDLPVASLLPAPTGAPGVFSDGLGPYLQGMSPEGQLNLAMQCDQTRVLALVLPPSWTSQVVSGTTNNCQGGTNGFHGLDLDFLVACPDGTSCPLGQPHVQGTSFGPEVRYYFNVTAPKPRGKGTVTYWYDVVWLDAVYRVTRWAGGVPNSTACEWQVNGSNADFWVGLTDAVRLDGGVPRSMLLDVKVARTDALCAA